MPLLVVCWCHSRLMRHLFLGRWAYPLVSEAHPLVWKCRPFNSWYAIKPNQTKTASFVSFLVLCVSSQYIVTIPCFRFPSCCFQLRLAASLAYCFVLLHVTSCISIASYCFGALLLNVSCCSSQFLVASRVA